LCQSYARPHIKDGYFKEYVSFCPVRVKHGKDRNKKNPVAFGGLAALLATGFEI